MANVKPFTCFRPAKALVQRFVQKPTDYPLSDRDENLEKLLSKSVYSISQPELFGKTFEDGKKKFADLFKNGFIFPDLNRAFYIYEIVKGQHSQMGIVGAQSLSDYDNDVIKVHEKTRKATRSYLYDRLTQLKLNFTPIYSFFKGGQSIIDFMDSKVQGVASDLLFNTADGCEHRVWKLDDMESISFIEEAFKTIPTVYLADGHHRLNMIQEVLSSTGVTDAKMNITNILFPGHSLGIKSFARALRDLTDAELALFESVIDAEFIEVPFTDMTSFGHFDFYYKEEWKRYRLKNITLDENVPEGIQQLQALSNNVFQPCFNILDERTDDRLLFLKDLGSPTDIEQLGIRTQAQLIVRLHPLDVEDIIYAAENNYILPPKSSLFEPKPRAGVFITQL